MMEQEIPICPKCGAPVNSESVRGQRKRYFCLENCGWGSYKKPLNGKNLTKDDSKC
jgi:hypothetical protein